MVLFKPLIRKMILSCLIQRSWACTLFMYAIYHKKNNFLLANRTSCVPFCVKHGVKILEKKNCIQRAFFKHGGIPKKTELKCLKLDHKVAGTQTFCMQNIL